MAKTRSAGEIAIPITHRLLDLLRLGRTPHEKHLIDGLADPEMGAYTLSALSGLLSKDGSCKAEDLTVVVHPDAANGNFPFAVPTDNHNAIKVPAEFPEDFEATMIGTGAFKLEKYTPKVGASFMRNADTGAPQRSQIGARSPSATTTGRRSSPCRPVRSTSSSRSRCCRRWGCFQTQA